jgi:hypothetical protein
VSYTTPQLDAAAAVAAALTGETIAGFEITAKADQLIPKYDQSLNELQTLRVDCVPGPEVRFAYENRQMAREDCPVNVGIQLECDADDTDTYRQLLALTRGIAKLLTFTALDDFGLPQEDVEFVDFPSAVEVEGRFFGIVGLMYRASTEAGA